MAPKKKGKANKLARMTEEEKLRYLQHRAAIEEEARRRKEHIISSFMKNKLKHEETFTRLNTAKINQQWRQTLRGIKNKELHDSTETLRQVFEVALKTKNKIIKNLISDLNDASKLHCIAVQTHLESIDKIINIQEDRLVNSSNHYIVTRDRKIVQNKKENERIETNYKKDIADFERALFWEKKCNKDKYNELNKLGTDYRNDIMYQMMCDYRNDEVKNQEIIKNLEEELKTIVKEYHDLFKPFKAHYKQLMEWDEQHMGSYVRNKLLIRNYEELIEKLQSRKNRNKEKLQNEINYLEKLVEEKKTLCSKLKKQVDNENKEAEKKLNHLSKVSNETIKQLQAYANQFETLANTMKNTNKYLSEKELILSSFRNPVISADDKTIMRDMKHFWNKQAELHVEIQNLEAHYASYLEENSNLKHLLEQYLKTVSRPSSIPSSLIRDKGFNTIRSSRPTSCR